jgi:hypothetical protein
LDASYDGFRCHAGTILDSSWSPTALELIEISSSSTEVTPRRCRRRWPLVCRPTLTETSGC